MTNKFLDHLANWILRLWHVRWAEARNERKLLKILGQPDTVIYEEKEWFYP
jgi:hypothetical protein